MFATFAPEFRTATYHILADNGGLAARNAAWDAAIRPPPREWRSTWPTLRSAAARDGTCGKASGKGFAATRQRANANKSQPTQIREWRLHDDDLARHVRPGKGRQNTAEVDRHKRIRGAAARPLSPAHRHGPARRGGAQRRDGATTSSRSWTMRDCENEGSPPAPCLPFVAFCGVCVGRQSPAFPPCHGWAHHFPWFAESWACSRGRRNRLRALRRNRIFRSHSTFKT